MAHTRPKSRLRIELHRGYALVTLIYMGAMTWFSLRPELLVEQTDPRVSLMSDLLHMPAFAGLAYCLLKTIRGHRQQPWGAIALAVLVAAAFAAVNESAQLLVPGRYASGQDLLLDLAGVTAVVVALHLPRRQPE